MGNDLISRQDAVDEVQAIEYLATLRDGDVVVKMNDVEHILYTMPSAHPEPAIPLSWIEGQIEWLKSLDNAFSTLTAVQISAMVNKWKDEQNE